MITADHITRAIAYVESQYEKIGQHLPSDVYKDLTGKLRNENSTIAATSFRDRLVAYKGSKQKATDVTREVFTFLGVRNAVDFLT